MPVWIVVCLSGIYIGVLFAIAWIGDRRNDAAGSAPERSPIVFALALTVYCTSWTFFGAVGTAASSGWNYLPIYLGPAMVFLVLPGLVKRIGDITQRESISSLSDFLAARYGKSRALAATATLAAIAGSVPYIALQLKSVATSFDALTLAPSDLSGGGARSTVLMTTVALGAFAILFGTRHADTTRKNTGLMHVLAFEAIVKLVALITVAILALALVGDADRAVVAETASRFSFGGPIDNFVTMVVLATAAIICLPRQFHVAMVERRSDKDMEWARFIFPIYLAITSAVVIPIALAGNGLLSGRYPPDLFVLGLPLSEGYALIALLVFLGGLSAAAGMVVVSCIALSTMITSDLVVPMMIRRGWTGQPGLADGDGLILIRRVAVIVLLALAYGYYQFAATTEALAQIGLISFAAAIQFAPALIGAVYWPRGHRDGALGGLIAGIAVWAYTLVLPQIVTPDQLSGVGLGGLFAPERLLAIDLGGSLTHGTIWSLGLNILIYITLSQRARVRLRDRIQAGVFAAATPRDLQVSEEPAARPSGVTPNGLKALASRFLGPDAVDAAFDQFERESGHTIAPDEGADWRLVQRTERLLASVLGSSSARVVMSSALAGSAVSLNDVLSILDQQTQAQRFDRHMLQSMLENVSQGISVVDGKQRLVAWNSAYIDLFQYPRSLIRLGQPIEDLIAHNIDRGWIRSDDPEGEIRNRLAHMRRGVPHRFERQNPDGQWLRIAGMPMPGGGYVSTFTDITQDKARETALMEAAETLEARVAERTNDLRSMARDLEKARKASDEANLSKTRFLAAASHDLLQPLNAARLFLGALEEQSGGDMAARLVRKTDRAIESADQLLRGLLDISRLDRQDIEPKLTDLVVDMLLEELCDEARPMAQSVGLTIRKVPTGLTVTADEDFLRSIIRNFLSNARRYTREGGVVVGARRRGGKVRIEVWDTGPGIPDHRQMDIFEEFERAEEADNTGVRGAGLGLAIASRMASAMDTTIGVRSTVGRGSVFYLDGLLMSSSQSQPSSVTSKADPPVTTSLKGLKVLCVDDEQSILDSMKLLLGVWGCDVETASSKPDAIHAFEKLRPDVVLLDLQLGGGVTGLDVFDALNDRFGGAITALLITAQNTDSTRAAAREHGLLDVLPKPVEPSDLKRALVRTAAVASQSSPTSGGDRARQAAE